MHTSCFNLKKGTKKRWKQKPKFVADLSISEKNVLSSKIYV